MKYSVIHFGPIRAIEYQDGYVEIGDVACGAMYITADNFGPADAQRLSVLPEKVTCQRCRQKIERQNLKQTKVIKVDGVHPYIASDPSRYSISKINLVRSACDLPPVLQSDARALHIEALKKSITNSQDLVQQGAAQRARADTLRVRWQERATTARLPDQQLSPKRLRSSSGVVDDRTIHLWPAQVSEYADGFTSASETFCGQHAAAYNSEDLEFDLARLNTDPALVTCSRCRKSKGFQQARKLGPAFAASQLRRIPRMRTAVLKRPELYDTERNNELRRKLGLDDVYRDRNTKNLIAEELAQYDEYARRRIASGTGALQRKLELLADLEGTAQTCSNQLNTVAGETVPAQETRMPASQDLSHSTMDDNVEKRKVGWWPWVLIGIALCLGMVYLVQKG
jgi:hypothetical protein